MFPACYKHAKKLLFQGGESVATMGNPLTIDKQVGKNTFAHLFMCWIKNALFLRGTATEVVIGDVLGLDAEGVEHIAECEKEIADLEKSIEKNSGKKAEAEKKAEEANQNVKAAEGEVEKYRQMSE